MKAEVECSVQKEYQWWKVSQVRNKFGMFKKW